MDGQMDGRTGERKSPCVLQDFVPLGALPQKNETLNFPVVGRKKEREKSGKERGNEGRKEGRKKGRKREEEGKKGKEERMEQINVKKKLKLWRVDDSLSCGREEESKGKRKVGRKEERK